MSNVLYIEALEVRRLDSESKEYMIVARDRYATAIMRCSETEENLWEKFPTKISVMEAISNLREFEDDIHMSDDDTDYTLYGLSGVVWIGFPYE